MRRVLPAPAGAMPATLRDAPLAARLHIGPADRASVVIETLGARWSAFPPLTRNQIRRLHKALGKAVDEIDADTGDRQVSTTIDLMRDIPNE